LEFYDFYAAFLNEVMILQRVSRDRYFYLSCLGVPYHLMIIISFEKINMDGEI